MLDSSQWRSSNAPRAGKSGRSASADRVVVIGAGIGGLVAALELAARGVAVVVLERAAAPGGKMREIEIGAHRIDSGPTVFTMRWVLEEIFARANASLSDWVTLRPADLLARHAWSDRERLDLFADIDRSADAIGTFAGAADARGYRRFCDRARDVFETLDRTFIRASRPSPMDLVGRVGLHRLPALGRIRPFASMWQALGEYFKDPRLRQLFARYATYCGSSPFRAPATLMLVAHVEREGVWLVEGGMHRLARALAELAASRGAEMRYDAEVAEIVVEGGAVAGVALASGERIDADAVVVNADVSALADGRFGTGPARAAPGTRRSSRSLSAVTWTLVAETAGFPLVRHNVFFGPRYEDEFADIFERSRLPSSPTVYVCAQDRDNGTAEIKTGPERLLCLVNAPPVGDAGRTDEAEMDRCEAETFGLLERCGLRVKRRPEATVMTTPADFERLFPATGGALYGPASHGWMASFARSGARTRLPGLHLAGGSVHPGPGVPMAALSGSQAAASVLADRVSTGPSRRTVISGGMSTR